MRTLVRSLALVLLLTGCDSEPDPASEAIAEHTPRTSAPSVPAATRESDTSPIADALRGAAMEGLTDESRDLIDAGADVNAADPDFRTPLMLAAFNGHAATVQLLLDRGARVSDRDVVGRSALMFASTGAFADTVELLLRDGADPNAADEGESWTALMFAAGEGQLEVVQTLLGHGADPSLIDLDGDTAADHARAGGHQEVATLLEQSMSVLERED